MFDLTTIILTSVFTLFGMAFFVYGKRESEFAFLSAGALLMVYPLFISGTIVVLLIGLFLTALPFVVRWLN